MRRGTSPEPPSPSPRRLRGFDIAVTPRTADQVAEAITQAVKANGSLIIANLNLHGLYMFETDPDFRAYTQQADLCLIDGWPILRLAQGRCLSSKYRIGSTDWLDSLLKHHNLRFTAIAGTPESSTATETVMRNKYNVQWRGIPGYDLDDRRSEIQTAIRDSDIILVGMGMPRQEQWILDNADLLRGKVVANVGGCIDYYNETQSLAPRWMGRCGIEWLYRLAKDPRRMAYRYLIEPILLLRRILLNHSTLAS